MIEEFCGKFGIQKLASSSFPTDYDDPEGTDEFSQIVAAYDMARNQMIRKMPQPKVTGEKPFKGILGRRDELVRFYNTSLEHTIELEPEA